jgi:hypothetical protein
VRLADAAHLIFAGRPNVRQLSVGKAVLLRLPEQVRPGCLQAVTGPQLALRLDDLAQVVKEPGVNVRPLVNLVHR